MKGDVPVGVPPLGEKYPLRKAGLAVSALFPARRRSPPRSAPVSAALGAGLRTPPSRRPKVSRSGRDARRLRLVTRRPAVSRVRGRETRAQRRPAHSAAPRTARRGGNFARRGSPDPAVSPTEGLQEWSRCQKIAFNNQETCGQQGAGSGDPRQRGPRTRSARVARAARSRARARRQLRSARVSGPRRLADRRSPGVVAMPEDCV